MISKQYKVLKENNLGLEVNSIYSAEKVVQLCPKKTYDEPCFPLSSEMTCTQCLVNEGFIEPVQPLCPDTSMLADYLIDGNIIYTSQDKFGIIAGKFIYYVDGYDELSTFYSTGISPSNTKIEAIYRNEYGWNFKVLSSKLPPTTGLELVWQSTSFTEQEMAILNALSSEYDIIERDANDNLEIKSSNDYTSFSFHMYSHLFKSLLKSTSYKFR